MREKHARPSKTTIATFMRFIALPCMSSDLFTSSDGRVLVNIDLAISLVVGQAKADNLHDGVMTLPVALW